MLRVLVIKSKQLPAPSFQEFEFGFIFCVAKNTKPAAQRSMSYSWRDLSANNKISPDNRILAKRAEKVIRELVGWFLSRVPL